MSRPNIACPWTRVVVGPFRGMRFRAAGNGVVLARVRRDEEMPLVDAKLRAAGWLIIDAPRGCQMEG